MGRTRSYRDILLISLFMAGLCAPALLMVSGFKFRETLTENRTKATFPEFNLKKISQLNLRLVAYIPKFNEYFEDHFTFRDMLIRMNRNIKLRIFKINPFPEKFVIGREGWMFLGNEHSRAISETKGLLNFSEAELDKISINISESMRFFENQGIMFYLAIAPEKSTVYGEFLPIVKSGKPTKLEQVREKLSGIGCRIVDMKKDFKKLTDPVIYYKSDSHWNEFGEFLGYQTLTGEIKRDFPTLRILQSDDFTVDTIRDYQGDNAQMLFLPWTDNKYIFSLRDTTPVAELPKQYSVPESYLWNPANYERRFGSTGCNLKILIFNDSFFREMPKFLAPGIRETVYIWSWWDKKIILNEKPDIVIYEKTERDIDHLLYPLK